MDGLSAFPRGPSIFFPMSMTSFEALKGDSGPEVEGHFRGQPVSVECLLSRHCCDGDECLGPKELGNTGRRTAPGLPLFRHLV